MNTNLTAYKNSLFKAMIMTGFIMLTFIGAECRAAVYDCSANATCYTTDPLITPAQLALKVEPKDYYPTVDQVLSGSNEQSITNGYNGIGNTFLGIKKFWHKGGDWKPTDDQYEHLTVEVYKDDAWQKTCHVYRHTTPKNKYVTTCR